MHNIRQTTPFFMVGNIRRSLEFYVDGLGSPTDVAEETRYSEWLEKKKPG